MSTSHLVIGSTVVGFILNAAIGAVLPEPAFLTVHGITYRDGVVYTDRTINHSAVGDWRVTVVPHDRDGPACNTVAGSNLHEGWSPYSESPRRVAPFPLDVWVNDIGCLERLDEDKMHDMFMSWVPRDETRPVTYHIEFMP